MENKNIKILKKLGLYIAGCLFTILYCYIVFMAFVMEIIWNHGFLGTSGAKIIPEIIEIILIIAFFILGIFIVHKIAKKSIKDTILIIVFSFVIIYIYRGILYLNLNWEELKEYSKIKKIEKNAEMVYQYPEHKGLDMQEEIMIDIDEMKFYYWINYNSKTGNKIKEFPILINRQIDYTSAQIMFQHKFSNGQIYYISDNKEYINLMYVVIEYEGNNYIVEVFGDISYREEDKERFNKIVSEIKSNANIKYELPNTTQNERTIYINTEKGTYNYIIEKANPFEEINYNRDMEELTSYVNYEKLEELSYNVIDMENLLHEYKGNNFEMYFLAYSDHDNRTKYIYLNYDNKLYYVDCIRDNIEWD